MNLRGLEFIDACRIGNLSEVKRLCSADVDINCRDWERYTGLYWACYGNRKRVVRFLLTLPALKVNVLCREGFTPFWLLCYWGFPELVALFLLDARVDVKRACLSGRTPLWTACHTQCLKTVKLLLASGRDLDFGRRDDHGLTALDVSRSNPECARVMEAYEADPRGTVSLLRREMNWVTPEALLLAFVVFLCDGLLGLSRYPLNDPRRRFFKMASVLPFELQMVLVNRCQRLAPDLVPFEDRERGFQHAARMYFRKQRTG